MSKQVQRRRGTTIEHYDFTGERGEITIDMEKPTVVVHDGMTVGGYPLALENHEHEGDYSKEGHNHDGVYAFFVHNHDNLYSLLTHDHDGVYVREDEANRFASKIHFHDDRYSQLDHNHDLSYALLIHDHDDDYASIEDFDISLRKLESSYEIVSESYITTSKIIDSVRVSEAECVKWIVLFRDYDNKRLKECYEILAIHDAIAGMDARHAYHNAYSTLRNAYIPGLKFDVYLAKDSEDIQFLCLSAESTEGIDTKVIRTIMPVEDFDIQSGTINPSSIPNNLSSANIDYYDIFEYFFDSLSTSLITYSAEGLLTEILYTTNHKKTISYNSNNKIAKVEFFTPSHSKIATINNWYDMNGELTASNVTKYGLMFGTPISDCYDLIDFYFSTLDTSKVEYDRGKLVRIEYKTNNVMALEYDEHDNPTRIKYYHIDKTKVIKQKDISYGSDGNITSIQWSQPIRLFLGKNFSNNDSFIAAISDSKSIRYTIKNSRGLVSEIYYSEGYSTFISYNEYNDISSVRYRKGEVNYAQVFITYNGHREIVSSVWIDSISLKNYEFIDRYFETLDIISISYTSFDKVGTIEYHTGNKKINTYNSDNLLLKEEYFEHDLLIKSVMYFYNDQNKISATRWS